jgi:hypothetical protein
LGADAKNSGSEGPRPPCHRDYVAFAGPVTGERQGGDRPVRRRLAVVGRGLLALREVERRLDVAGGWRPASTIRAIRARTLHSVADILRFRMLMIAAGYEDGIDANACAPTRCSRWRWSGCPARAISARSRPSAGWRTCPTGGAAAHGARHGRALLRQLRQVPKRITLDIDDTFDAVHGGQQLRLFNAHYDDYGFQPIVVFDGAGRFVAAVLRPAKRPKGREIAAHLRR